MQNIINLGDTVVIHSNEDKQFNIVKVNGEQKIGRSRVQLKDLVGEQYGTVFEVINRKLVKIQDDECVFDLDASNENSNTTIRGDNSGYIDSNTAQKLSDMDIFRLKESGLTGEQIIQSLIVNSNTFATKTEFAQEKWIKRKEKKYKKKIRVFKSNPATLCEAYFSKSKDKICGMRYDSLAQIISQSGIYSGCRVLVLESMVGLIVGFYLLLLFFF
jgi:tRNA (adenine-N(1)-)-methyltransferase non-catalytic subunit